MLSNSSRSTILPRSRSKEVAVWEEGDLEKHSRLSLQIISRSNEQMFLFSYFVPLKISVKNKQRRRIASTTKHSKLLTRSVMDIPTTDPGSDFLESYTTEDECETDYDTEGNVITKTSISRIARIFRGDIRKASSVSYETIVMPPELIITKVSDDNQPCLSELATENKTAVETKPPPSFTQNIIKEFPPIGKKTKSWHNFNRCMSTVK